VKSRGSASIQARAAYNEGFRIGPGYEDVGSHDEVEAAELLVAEDVCDAIAVYAPGKVGAVALFNLGGKVIAPGARRRERSMTERGGEEKGGVERGGFGARFPEQGRPLGERPPPRS
jgi:hypothetical protein